MLKLSYLLGLTDKNIRSYANGVSVTGIRSFQDRDRLGEHKKVIVQSEGDTKTRYQVFKFYDAGQGAKSRVWVTCSCEYWLFVCEVATWARDSTSNINSNGDFPAITNPNMKPKLCKHLYASALDAVNIQAQQASGKELKNLRKSAKNSIYKGPTGYSPRESSDVNSEDMEVKPLKALPKKAQSSFNPKLKNKNLEAAVKNAVKKK